MYGPPDCKRRSTPLPHLLALRKMESIPMEISTIARALALEANLVLHVDVQKLNAQSGPRYTYSSTLYKTHAHRLESKYPLPPPTENTILYYSGARLQELQATLSFADILLDRSYPAGYRKTVESWLLECEDRQRSGFHLCLKVRHKGIDADPRLDSSWLIRQWRNFTDAPSLVSQSAHEAFKTFDPNIYT
jgi:hypothetical protein